MPPSFAAVGELMLDLELVRGAHAHAARITVRVGGTAANAAVWAASAGAEAACVGRVGADAAGAAIRVGLIERTVQPLLQVDPDQRTGTVAHIDGELVVDRGANRSLEPAEIDADALLVSGYAVLSDEGAAVAATLHSSAAIWSVATAGSAGLLAGKREEFVAATAAARVVVANLDEARVLTGRDDPEAAVRELAGRYEVACVTIGGAGAVLATGNALHRCEPRSPVAGPARGAGDALAATLVVALARGEAPAAALEQACEAGACAAASPTGWPA